VKKVFMPIIVEDILVDSVRVALIRRNGAIGTRGSAVRNGCGACRSGEEGGGFRIKNARDSEKTFITPRRHSSLI